jgi:hypothetical protein
MFIYLGPDQAAEVAAGSDGVTEALQVRVLREPRRRRRVGKAVLETPTLEVGHPAQESVIPLIREGRERLEGDRCAEVAETHQNKFTM